MKPLIGLTSYRHKFAWNKPGPDLQGAVLADDYTQAIEEAGGIPLVIPYLETEEAVRHVVERLDGLILTGGNDIDPSIFGEEPHKGLGEVCPERDWLEVTLVRYARQFGKPLLGICRGMQVINAALGGTLYQDLAREWAGSIQHSQRAARHHLSHKVHIKPGSQLFHLLGAAETLRTNSFHHQAVRDVAPGLVAVAWDDEGLVEAVEAEEGWSPGASGSADALGSAGGSGTPGVPGGPGTPRRGTFLVAVQWHPENLWRTTPVFLGLFRGLVEAAHDGAVHDIGLAGFPEVSHR
ncbi:gamma-glutamyl-gamma-aminobutyrate hydrolase family protein [Alicyclobacillus cycloheptanicus]|uniref:Glutamine amidotransferase n=1 Tax=Alicyclobacillus cycloheptanicus TaxID=1457 RepID=A0ABT9XJV9_9BACL|nr:gamma-glutamyl-gamma-aminobutyrate hydrolase family protein [Alicyclobacillus cycloheptanicus]MDQ0190068.1 putative glutamine amidotransferase [Alicyclobacillus cycloheptanicus]